MLAVPPPIQPAVAARLRASAGNAARLSGRAASRPCADVASFSSLYHAVAALITTITSIITKIIIRTIAATIRVADFETLFNAIAARGTTGARQVANAHFAGAARFHWRVADFACIYCIIAADCADSLAERDSHRS